uniref:WGS project CAEQ00000000 data, annotated contig 881 n=1 Tax=Trypanosoma congolense (strain IL3000) TaxID=1068625 RepID=F9WJ72_TRYCI|nr:unnamed protein product [Trypanosoma congolense IL3000]
MCTTGMRVALTVLCLTHYILEQARVGATPNAGHEPNSVNEFTLFAEGEEHTYRLAAVDSVHIHSLVKVGDVLVAIGERRYRLAGEMRLNTFSLCSVDGGKTWTKDVIAVGMGSTSYHSYPILYEAIVKENSIYLFAGGYDIDTVGTGNINISSRGWDPLLIVGKVEVSRGLFSQSAKVTWGTQVPLKGSIPDGLRMGPVSKFYRGVKGAVVTEVGSLVFLVELTNSHNQDVPVVIYSTNDGENWNLEPLDPGVCKGYCHIFVWNGRLMLGNQSSKGHQIVYESINFGREWVEAVTSYSRVWAIEAEHGKLYNFVTATVEGRRVLVFAQRSINDKLREVLRIWLSDGDHFAEIDHIHLDDDIVGEGTLLFDENTLLYFYRKIGYLRDEFSSSVPYDIGNIAQLDDALAKIKSVLRMWKIESTGAVEGGGVVKNLRCIDVSPVVLLSNDVNATHWKDVYGTANINVTGATKADGGVLFRGTNRGAAWYVGERSGTQMYTFVNYEFTLVMTVVISEGVKENIPVLAVAINEGDSNKILEVSYNADGRWHLTFGGKYVPTVGFHLHNSTHQVAVTMYGGSFSVKVDGTALSSARNSIKVLKQPSRISYFYIGGYGNPRTTPNGELMVRNVALYKRELSSLELDVMFLQSYWARCPAKSLLVAQEKPAGDGVEAPGRMGLFLYLLLAIISYAVQA